MELQITGEPDDVTDWIEHLQTRMDVRLVSGGRHVRDNGLMRAYIRTRLREED